MQGPLSHLKVLDLSRVLAGPWAGQTLADLGAEVIKVERPGTGDDTRGWGPPFLASKDGGAIGDAGYFLSANRGKRSVTVNIQTPEGQEVIRRLAARADILIENFKTGTLARYGLDYESLKAINRGLVYCSVTGFGQTGPRRHQVAYDFLVQAMGGIMSLTGEPDGNPGGGPQKIGVAMNDLTTGLYAVIGILAAVARRAETGEGDHIDIAMLDVQAALLANQAMNHLLTGAVPRRYGNSHPNVMPQQAFQCADGPIILAVGNDGQFARLCAALGDPGMAEDDRFRENRGRVENRDALTERLSGHLGGLRRADLLPKLEAAGVPAGPINSVKEVFEEPQIAAREMVGTLDHPLAGPVPQVFGPLKFASTRHRPTQAPPVLGADTDRVLADLGYSAEEITALREAGSV